VELKIQGSSKSDVAADIIGTGVVNFGSNDQNGKERRWLRVAAENRAGIRRIEEHIVPAPEIASPWLIF
jgi:hypothetical protein